MNKSQISDLKFKKGTRALAILEGPESVQVPGMRHCAIVERRGAYPRMVLSHDGGRKAAAAMGARHYPAGTWEAPGLPPNEHYDNRRPFPLPRPEILTEIFETKQGELAV